MPVKSLDMGDATWNNQIRGDGEWAKLFHTQAITFHSTRLEHTDGNSGMLYGDLTLAGVKRPVALQLKFNKIGKNEVSEFPSVGFSATTTLKRSDFGLDAYSDLVGDEIAVQIQVEAAQGKDFDAKHATTALGVKH
jgi:polyisoprenoid-binding protein YceI